MKILYFSGTGNSYATATLIAGNYGEVYDMGDTADRQFTDEYVGIVTPCYCGDVPFKVRKFLSEAKIESPYIFAVVTCGASVGNSFVTINNCLEQNGAKLSYMKKLVLPDNCIIFATPTKQATKQMKKHKGEVAKINNDLSNKIINATNLSHKKTPTIRTKLLWWAFKNVFKISDKKTNARCIHCGKCVDFCSVGNIKIENGKVIFGSHCENCFGCIQRCPKMAIEFGKVKVSNATRFIHPVFVDGKEFK